MKRAATITIGVVLAGLISGCFDEPEEPDFSEICIDPQMEILPEDRCEGDDDYGSGNHFIYIPGSTYVGAHGTRYAGAYSSVRPTSGTVARVPATGGFGTHGGSVPG